MLINMNNTKQYTIGEFYLTRHGSCKLIKKGFVNGSPVLVFEKDDGFTPIIKFYVAL